MAELLGTARLKSGEEMAVKRVECPAGEYAEPLANFLEHKSDSVLRDIKQRLRGDYARDVLDRFFIGEVAGEIVSQMWYTIPRDTLDVGVFGHVYTARRHREKGAAAILMKFCMDDFNASDGKGLFCGVGTEHAQRVYARYGFHPLYAENAPLGPQGYIRPGLAKDFRELQEVFFRPGASIRVRAAHMGDRAKVDKILLQSDGVRAAAARRHAVSLAGSYRDFVTMVQAVEDGKGPLLVLETAERHVVGYAFAFSAGLAYERDSKFLDFLAHPHYQGKAPAMIQEVLSQAKARGVWALVPACDEERIASVREAGMVLDHTLKGYCTVGNQATDLCLFRA